MKKYVFVIIILLTVINLNAQKKNNIEIGYGGYHFPLVTHQPDELFSTLNIKYSREIVKDFQLKIQYTLLPVQATYLLYENFSLGEIVYRLNYNYFDFGAEYNVWQFNNHRFSASGAISLAYGKNKYLIAASPSGYEFLDPLNAVYEEKMETYFGGVLDLHYDYTFWKNRLNIGPDFSLRYYNNDFPFQVNYGFHLGFNF